MVRVGQNPMKFHDDGIPWHDITFVTAVHIPHLSGYWQESLDVLKVCLASLLQDKSVPFDIMVIDNGSCKEVGQYLSSMFEQRHIQFLISSEYNLGKGGALNLGLAGAPGRYLAYADCDVIFNPGWLRESLAILEAMPRVGMVTARPNRSKKSLESGKYRATFELLKSLNAKINVGRLIDQEILKEHALSAGIREEYEDFDCDDTLVEFNETKAYVGAYHFQFLTKKEVASKILPLEASSSLATGPDHAWDQRMNDLGYAKFTVTQPLCRHMGNTLCGEAPEALHAISHGKNLPQDNKKLKQKQLHSRLAGFLQLFLNFPKVRGLYTYLYRVLFEVIS